MIASQFLSWYKKVTKKNQAKKKLQRALPVFNAGSVTPEPAKPSFLPYSRPAFLAGLCPLLLLRFERNPTPDIRRQLVAKMWIGYDKRDGKPCLGTMPWATSSPIPTIVGIGDWFSPVFSEALLRTGGILSWQIKAFFREAFFVNQFTFFEGWMG